MMALKRTWHKLGPASPERVWTGSILLGAASQRAGALLSTLYFIHFIGADRFAKVVPLTPVAGLVSAVALVGQDSAILRVLLQTEDHRVRLSELTRTCAVVIAGGLTLGTASAILVSDIFNIPLYCSAMSAGGGVLLALAMVAAIPQIRARRQGPRYLCCYLAYGVTSILARLVAHHSGCSDQLCWSIGDLTSGAVALVVGVALAPPSLHGKSRLHLDASLRFGIPLIPNFIAQQLLGTGDRWVFAGRVPPIQLAIYVATYQVANIVSVIMSEINRARQNHYVTDPSVGEEAELSERKFLLQIVAFTALPVALLGAALSGLNFGESFLIGLGICISFASIAYYLPIANLFAMSLGRTGPLAKASAVGAIVNLAINIALVFSLGVWSGLIANFIGYWCMFGVLAMQRQRAQVLAAT